MAKYSTGFKLKIVLEYLAGEASQEGLCAKYGIKSSYQLKTGVRAYQAFGQEGLRRSRKNRIYSVEFKLGAIEMYESSEKSYADVAIELGLNNPSLIANWRRQFYEEGIGGLSKKRGRPRSVKKDKSSKPMLNKPTLASEDALKRIQELEYENRLLRIKNEYLEMLRGLRLQKTTKRKQESSTNSEKNIN